MGKKAYIVSVPEVHVERRLVTDADSPEEAAYMAKHAGLYIAEDTYYTQDAPLSEAVPVTVMEQDANEEVAFTSDDSIAKTRKDLTNMANKPAITAGAAQSTLQAVGSTLLADTKDAAWRLATEETVETVRAPLAAVLMRQIGVGENSFIGNGISKFLETRAGDGVVSLGLAVMLPLVQGSLPANMQAHATRMGKELRIRGIGNVAAPFIKAVMNPLRDVMVMQIEAMKNSGAPAEMLEIATAPTVEEVVAAEIAAPAAKAA